MATRVSVDEARSLISAAVSPLGDETVPLAEASGRTLSDAVVAAYAQPPFDASAMDGYAVRLADVQAVGARLPVVGQSAAGARHPASLAPGAAVRIFTGAPVPEGADHVLIQEDAERDGDMIVVRAAQARTQHIRRASVDFSAGETLIAAGETMSGAKLALAAAADAARLRVKRRPRIALLASGDELVLPGALRRADDIPCSIPYALVDRVTAWGGAPSFLGVARDDKADIRAHLAKADGFDLVAPIGGASVGDRDLMRAAFADAGFETIFEKVAIRPGMPAWFARRGAGFALGLPGNPASALVTSALFLRLAIRRFLGAPADGAAPARLESPLAANGPRESYLRATFRISSEGVAIVRPFSNQDSSLLSVMAAANALIRRRPDAPPAAAGDLVECVML